MEVTDTIRQLERCWEGRLVPSGLSCKWLFLDFFSYLSTASTDGLRDKVCTGLLEYIFPMFPVPANICYLTLKQVLWDARRI